MPDIFDNIHRHLLDNYGQQLSHHFGRISVLATSICGDGGRLLTVLINGLVVNILVAVFSLECSLLLVMNFERH